MVDHHHHNEHHVTSIRTYFAVALALLLLTALTVGVAFVNLGPFNDLVAMAIASTKATLILLFFMHVRGSTPLVKLAVVAGVLWLALLIVGILDDYLTRSWFNIPGH